MIILLILINFALDKLWISLGENWWWSLVGPKGLRGMKFIKIKKKRRGLPPNWVKHSGTFIQGTPSGPTKMFPKWSLGWGLLIINQQKFSFILPRNLLQSDFKLLDNALTYPCDIVCWIAKRAAYRFKRNNSCCENCRNNDCDCCALKSQKSRRITFLLWC